jgi:hypothetical protein
MIAMRINRHYPLGSTIFLTGMMRLAVSGFVSLNWSCESSPSLTQSRIACSRTVVLLENTKDYGGDE